MNIITSLLTSSPVPFSFFSSDALASALAEHLPWQPATLYCYQLKNITPLRWIVIMMMIIGIRILILFPSTGTFFGTKFYLYFPFSWHHSGYYKQNRKFPRDVTLLWDEGFQLILSILQNPRRPWGQHSKFYVSYSTYPYMAYPDYCLGWIVASTLPTIETLLQEVCKCMSQ